MPINPQIGKAGGQQYDVALAIRTFLGQMVEGGINVAAAVIKELLQNADDAGATEVHVVLDERPQGDGIPTEYQPLLTDKKLREDLWPFNSVPIRFENPFCP